MSSFSSSLPLRLCTGLALLVAPTLLGARGCTGESHELCTTEYAPVCGEDGATYGNACEADRAGVEIAHEGVCEEPPPVCEPVLCTLYCEGGFARDPATGCEVCACEEPPPVCEPVLCDLYCEFGFAIDERGCETCSCRPAEPTICASDAECAEGERCEPVACPAICAIPEDGGPEECVYDCPPGICVADVPPPPPPPPPAECTSDADCADGQYCSIPAVDCACVREPCDCGPPPTTGYCAWREDDPSVPPGEPRPGI